MELNTFNEGLLEFPGQSPTPPWHAVSNMAGSRDAHSLYRVLRRYFELASLWH